MSIPLEDADTGREHITDDSEECWCKPRVILVPPARNDKDRGAA